MEMDWIGLDLDQHPPNLAGCGSISINIHFHPFSFTYQKLFYGFLGGLESMYELLEYESLLGHLGVQMACVARCPNRDLLFHTL
jgi:hypothetical protein